MRTQRRSHSISDFRYTPLTAALLVALAPATGNATTQTVDTNVDSTDVSGTSLRKAINFFNTTGNCTGAGADVINFDASLFTPNGPFVSNLSTPLPPILCAGLTIDGGGHQFDTISRAQIVGSATIPIGFSALTSAPVILRGMEVSGFTYGTAFSGNIAAVDNIVHDNDTGIFGNTGSVIVRNRVYSNSTGIYVAYGGEQIQLNVVYANTDGIDVENVASITVANNFVGVDDGTRPDLVINGNSDAGVYLLNSTANVTQNTISGNTSGVYLDTDHGSILTTNKIGTDVTGMVGVGNTVGIKSVTSSIGTVISGNVISGNSSLAIKLDVVTGISITGNLIGTDVTGTASLLNGEGIAVACGSGVMVSDNVIGTAHGGGIEFDGMTGGGVLNIVGNKIGVTGDGVTRLGSHAYGVILRSSSCVLSGPPSSTDGVLINNNVIANGSSDGILLSGANNTNIAGNTIVANRGFGVDLASGLGNQILDNVISGNSAFMQAQPKNINLGFPGGPRPNNPGGAHVATVPNDGQNYPVITSVSRNFSGNYTMVSFTLDSLPGTYRIDIYGNSSPTTEPGGDQLLGNTFLPVASGPTSGSFAVPGVTADYFSLLATTVPASGTGETSEFSPVVNVVTAPGVSVSASSMNFGNVAINSDSPPHSVTFTSSGTGPYQIGAIGDGTCYGGSICYGGPFTCTSTCAPASYIPGASCQITATFHPPSLGSFSRTIAVCDNVSPFSRTISLTGTGVVPPAVSITPASFNFGSTLLRTHSTPNKFTVTNPGGITVSMGPAVTTSDFEVLGTNCGSTLEPGASCAVTVDFDPTGLGQINGTLSIAAATGKTAFSSKGARLAKLAAGPAATSALTGTGTIEADLALPSAIDFGAYTSGTPALRRFVTLANNGNAVLSFSSISVTGPFVLGNGCPENMQPGESCTLTLDFSEAALGNYTGSLVVLSNAKGGSRAIPLTAQTVAAPAPLIQVSPLLIGFGDRLLGSSSASQRVTIANVGNAPAVLSPPQLTTTDFLVTTTCGATLAPASSCFADVSLRPVGFGPRQGLLLINSNAVGSPVSVALSGSGCRPFSRASSRLGANFGCLP